MTAALSRGWSAWHRVWSEKARRTKLLKLASAMLIQPKLVAAYSHWSRDWSAQQARDKEEAERAAAEEKARKAEEKARKVTGGATRREPHARTAPVRTDHALVVAARPEATRHAVHLHGTVLGQRPKQVGGSHSARLCIEAQHERRRGVASEADVGAGHLGPRAERDGGRRRSEE